MIFLFFLNHAKFKLSCASYIFKWPHSLFYYINTPNIMPLDILLLGMFKFLLKKKSEQTGLLFYHNKKIPILWLLDSFKINSQSSAYHKLYVFHPPPPLF